MTFKRYICWETDQVHRVINPDAEYVADEVFLAIHSEHPLWMADPNDLQKRWNLDAQDFLAEFLSPNRTHVQAAIIGGSGSGKSHLIHWMRLNIPRRDDQYVLSIPRSGTSLRGILERVIEILPVDRQRKYRERLEMAGYYNQDQTQRRERLLDEIALAIRSDSPRDDAQEPETEAWLIDNLPHLFHDPYYRQLYAPNQANIIDQLVTHVTEAPQEYHRVTERRAFRRDDLPTRNIDATKLSSVARDFFTPLLGMSEYLDLAVDIINRNLDTAIGRMLNFTGDQLIQLMQDVRRFLYQEGKTLILLVEDFARVQGIDTALLQSLIEASGTGKDRVCELRWAMAVTTGYYERLPNTVQTRMTFVVDMNLPVMGDNALISESDIVAFTTRYLNAVRLGGAKLKDWYEKVENTDQGMNVPNYCDECQYRETCHHSFGQINDFGLYPFTSKAIVNMARYKGAVQEGFNPRRLIKDVLAEVLDRHRDELVNGEFPSQILHKKMIETGRGLAPADVEKLRQSNPHHYLRQRSVLELWGSLTQMVKLPDGLYEAFDLPAPQIDGKKEKNGPQPPPPPPPPSPPLDWRIEAVRNWANGASLMERGAGDLRKLIYDAVISYIDWDAVGLEQTYFTRRQAGPFRERYIIFRNQQTQTRARLGAVHLTIPLTEEDNDLMQSALAIEGLLQFRHRQSWNFPNGEQHLVALSECLEVWSAALLDAFEQLPDKLGKWNPVTTGLELLAIGSALAGLPVTSKPTPAECVNALFANWPDEAPVQSSVWQKLYHEIRGKRGVLDRAVRARISGTKGGQIGGFIDTTNLLPPLLKLRRTWLLRTVAAQKTDNLREPYRSLAALHAKVKDELPVVVQQEYDQKIAWLNNVRQHIPPGTKQMSIIQTLRQVRDSAMAAGLGINQMTLMQFEAVCLEFEEVDLTKTFQEITSLSRSEAQVKILPKLVSDSNLRTMEITSNFLEAAMNLRKEIDRVAQQEIHNLKKPGIDVSAVQQQIRTNLSELKRLLAIFGGE